MKERSAMSKEESLMKSRENLRSVVKLIAVDRRLSLDISDVTEAEYDAMLSELLNEEVLKTQGMSQAEFIMNTLLGFVESKAKAEKKAKELEEFKF